LSCHFSGFWRFRKLSNKDQIGFKKEWKRRKEEGEEKKKKVGQAPSKMGFESSTRRSISPTEDTSPVVMAKKRIKILQFSVLPAPDSPLTRMV